MQQTSSFADLAFERNLPAPLCGKDGGFTYISIVDRLAAIVSTTAKKLLPHAYSQEEYNVATSNLELLAKELRECADKPPQVFKVLSIMKDAKEWQAYETKYQVANKSWLELPWLFVEIYVYRLMLDAVNYNDDAKRDCFAQQKMDALTEAIKSGAAASLAEFYENNKEDANSLLTELMLHNLWNNAFDLSLTAGHVEKHAHKEDLLEPLLSNDVQVTLDHLKSKPSKVCFLIDNAGLELVSDLLFAAALLETKYATSVTFYLKFQPIFVSDAMIKDVLYTLDQLEQASNTHLHSVVQRLREYMKQGLFILKEEYYMTSPLPMWEIPDSFRQQLSTFDLCIVKGDANYRRVVGDLHWDCTQVSMSDVCKPYFPTSVVCMRTLKSDSLVGLVSQDQQQRVQELNKTIPNWRVSGKFGVIQFVNK